MKTHLLLALLLCGAWPTLAADEPVHLSEGWSFTQTDGAALYRAICQGCHMADGRGAAGAGAYPALAGNARLASAGYVMITVMRGRRGMPAFGEALSDAQLAEVTRYVRTQFGNRYEDPVTAQDAKALR